MSKLCMVLNTIVKKIKEYVDGSNYCCATYDKSYSRSNYTCNKICEEGRKFSDDDRPISYSIFNINYIIKIISYIFK